MPETKVENSDSENFLNPKFWQDIKVIFSDRIAQSIVFSPLRFIANDVFREKLSDAIMVLLDKTLAKNYEKYKIYFRILASVCIYLKASTKDKLKAEFPSQQYPQLTDDVFSEKENEKAIVALCSSDNQQANINVPKELQALFFNLAVTRYAPSVQNSKTLKWELDTDKKNLEKAKNLLNLHKFLSACAQTNLYAKAYFCFAAFHYFPEQKAVVTKYASELKDKIEKNATTDADDLLHAAIFFNKHKSRNDWLKKSMQQGNLAAKLRLAFLYSEGDESSKKIGFRLFQEAADEGGSEALHKLAMAFYAQGNLQRAFECYEKAAKQGHGSAQLNLAFYYEKGKGIEINLNQAFNWYQKAAVQGLEKAQYKLAYCYAKGSGTEKNFNKAFEWYQKAAEQGFPSAQYMLGVCFEEAQGTEKNQEKAKEWYQKAAKNGNERAMRVLAINEVLSNSKIKELLKLQTPSASAANSITVQVSSPSANAKKSGKKKRAALSKKEKTPKIEVQERKAEVLEQQYSMQTLFSESKDEVIPSILTMAVPTTNMVTHASSNPKNERRQVELGSSVKLETTERLLQAATNNGVSIPSVAPKKSEEQDQVKSGKNGSELEPQSSTSNGEETARNLKMLSRPPISAGVTGEGSNTTSQADKPAQADEPVETYKPVQADKSVPIAVGQTPNAGQLPAKKQSVITPGNYINENGISWADIAEEEAKEAAKKAQAESKSEKTQPGKAQNPTVEVPPKTPSIPNKAQTSAQNAASDTKKISWASIAKPKQAAIPTARAPAIDNSKKSWGNAAREFFQSAAYRENPSKVGQEPTKQLRSR